MVGAARRAGDGRLMARPLAIPVRPLPLLARIDASEERLRALLAEAHGLISELGATVALVARHGQQGLRPAIPPEAPLPGQN